jgi:hypothetical protein
MAQEKDPCPECDKLMEEMKAYLGYDGEFISWVKQLDKCRREAAEGRRDPAECERLSKEIATRTVKKYGGRKIAVILDLLKQKAGQLDSSR